MAVTLLIDGDIEIFKAASVNQEVIRWDEDTESIDVNPKGAEAYLVSALSHYRDILKADRMILCFTGSVNWRKQLWPEYKAHRKDKDRPELLDHCRAFCMTHYENEQWPRLEADDVMGLLSKTIRGSIIVSVDKDMRCVPGRLYNPAKPEQGVVMIDDIGAYEWHMLQTLTGDATDGYKGCPGVGPKKAQALIEEVRCAFDPIQNYSNWRYELWNAVVKRYESKGLAVDDAVMNARLAYILRMPGEYNRETTKIRLWKPPM